MLTLQKSRCDGVPFRARRSMAAAAVGDSLYFFAGVGANTLSESILDVSNDLWSWSTIDERWTAIEIQESWPEARRCCGWLQHQGALRLWGGSGITQDSEGKTRYTFLNDDWSFDVEHSAWVCNRASDDHRQTPFDGGSDSPFPRYTPVLQSAQERLFLFGGYTEDPLGKRKLNDAWLQVDGRWQPVIQQGRAGYDLDATWPGVRYGSMSTSDGKSIYVCGGFSDDGDHIDLWRFDVRSARWEPICGDATSEDATSSNHATPNRPQPRYCAAFAWHGNRLFLFGGRSRKQSKLNFNDLWCFDLTSRTWHEIYPQSDEHRYDESAVMPGYHAKAAHVALGDHWYLWGGEGRTGHVSDFWSLNFTDLRWRMIQPARADDPSFW